MRYRPFPVDAVTVDPSLQVVIQSSQHHGVKGSGDHFAYHTGLAGYFGCFALAGYFGCFTLAGCFGCFALSGCGFSSLSLINNCQMVKHEEEGGVRRELLSSAETSGFAVIVL